jgi:hypothetical protein
LTTKAIAKAGGDVGVADCVRGARNASDASHTAPFTDLPDGSFNSNPYTTTNCRPKQKAASHKVGKRMIPLRLELRTACVLDRSDNQLHHRTNC